MWKNVCVYFQGHIKKLVVIIGYILCDICIIISGIHSYMRKYCMCTTKHMSSVMNNVEQSVAKLPTPSTPRLCLTAIGQSY